MFSVYALVQERKSFRHFHFHFFPTSYVSPSQAPSLVRELQTKFSKWHAHRAVLSFENLIIKNNKDDFCQYVIATFSIDTIYILYIFHIINYLSTYFLVRYIIYFPNVLFRFLLVLEVS